MKTHICVDDTVYLGQLKQPIRQLPQMYIFMHIYWKFDETILF